MLEDLVHKLADQISGVVFLTLVVSHPSVCNDLIQQRKLLLVSLRLIVVLEAIRDGVVKPDADTILSLNEDATMLSRLVNDLQELSLAEAGELRLNRQAEDIGRLIKQVAAARQPQAAAKGFFMGHDTIDQLLLG